MKRFAKLFVTLTTLLSLTPTVIFGANGDIIDISRNVKYSVSSSSDKSALKSDLKSGATLENDLLIELPSGKYVRYTDKKDAERQAILSVITKYGVEMSDASALREALITHNEEISALQETNVNNLEGQKLPPLITTPSKDVEAISSAHLDYRYTPTSCTFSFTDINKVNGQEYTGEFYVKAYDTNSILLREFEADFNTQYTIDTSSEVYLEVGRTREDGTIRLNLSREGTGYSNWQFSESDSSAIVGISGDTENGYTLAYTVSLMEISKTGESRAYTGTPALQICNEQNNREVMLTVPLTENLTGSIHFDTIDYPLLTYNIIDSVTGSDLINGELSAYDYSVSDMVSLGVDTTQSKNRRYVEITPIKLKQNYDMDSVFIEVRQGDSIVIEKNVPVDDVNDLILTEGNYTINMYPTFERKGLLGTNTFDFVHEPITGLTITAMENGVDYTLLPWNYGVTKLDVKLLPMYNDYAQMDENFKYKITDLASGSIINCTIQHDDTLQLPVYAGSKYKIDMLNSDGTVGYTTTYIAPFYTQMYVTGVAVYTDEVIFVPLEYQGVQLKDALRSYASLTLRAVHKGTKEAVDFEISREHYEKAISEMTDFDESDPDSDTIHNLILPINEELSDLLKVQGNSTYMYFVFKDADGHETANYGLSLVGDGYTVNGIDSMSEPILEKIPQTPVTVPLESPIADFGAFTEKDDSLVFVEEGTSTSTPDEEDIKQKETIFIKRDEDLEETGFAIADDDDFDILLPELN